jgi:hypothetical protein
MSRTLLLLATILLASGCERRPNALAPSRVPDADRKPRPRKTPLPRRAIPPLLPEQGPHPDYPTPLAAGTDKLFFLEEPERGPLAPATVTPPSPGSLRRSFHLHCEPHLLGLSCGPARPRPPARGPYWRLGARGKELVLAESLHAPDPRPRRSFLLERGASGLDRIVLLDARGTVSEARFFDRARSRCSGRKLSGENVLEGCGQLSFKLDAAGRPIELGCLQWLGEPMLDRNGVARTGFRLDRSGLVLERRRLGLDGDPVAGHDGIHLTRYERDREGRVLSERHFGLEDKPVRSEGCHGHRHTLDPLGREVRRGCLDLDGRPSTSIVSEHYRYDERGCWVSSRYFLGEERARNRLNLHGLDFLADETCNTVEQTCVNLVEQPLPCGPGEPARYRYQRDARGWIVSTRHFGSDGAPGTDTAYGVHELRRQHDARGNMIGQSCYSAKGEPMLCGSTGFHALLWRRDDAGRSIEERFLGVDGAPSSNLGCHLRRFQYDNYDHLYESRNHDAKGALTGVMGTAVRRELYDAGHRRFAVLLLDRAGKPARYKGCYSGVECPRGSWHAVRIVRLASGSVEKNQYFDHAGQLIHTLGCQRHRCWK